MTPRAAAVDATEGGRLAFGSIFDLMSEEKANDRYFCQGGTNNGGAEHNNTKRKKEKGKEGLFLALPFFPTFSLSG